VILFTKRPSRRIPLQRGRFFIKNCSDWWFLPNKMLLDFCKIVEKNLQKL